MFRHSRGAPGAAASVLTCLLLTSTFAPAIAQSSLSRGELRTLQETLNDLGYQAGPEDGLYGDNTAEAIRAFERANELAVTGEADPALLDRLTERVQTQDGDTGQDGDTAQERAAQAQSAEGRRNTTTATGTPEGPDAGAETAEVGSQMRGNPGDGSDDPADGIPDANMSATVTDQGDGEAPAPDVSALTGTRWRVRDETGSTFTMTFRPGGRLEGPTVSGNWAWRRDNDRLVIEFDAGPGMSTERTAPWPGDAQTMTGAAESSAGHEWTWRAQKIGGANPSG